MQDIIIVGAGGFGREVLELIDSLNKKNPKWNILGFLDDNLNALKGYDMPAKIIGTIQNWEPSEKEWYALAIADPKVRYKIMKDLHLRGARFATLISEKTDVGKRVHLGEGVIIFGNTGIDIDVTIGNGVFINTFCSIGHDTTIGDCTVIAPGVCISGACTIGEQVNLGGHSYLIPRRRIGDRAVIAAGSVVFTNVRESTTVLGNPAKRMRELES